MAWLPTQKRTFIRVTSFRRGFVLVGLGTDYTPMNALMGKSWMFKQQEENHCFPFMVDMDLTYRVLCLGLTTLQTSVHFRLPFQPPLQGFSLDRLAVTCFLSRFTNLITSLFDRDNGVNRNISMLGL